MKPPEWLRPDEKRDWLRLWRQSFRLIKRMSPEERARGVTSAFPLRLTVEAKESL
ncbi:hypothetical protein [Paracoccus thiocyanatus]|uniref:hypothetical protein n=1 Tax=Paracoccus thiocyanatus TaxID=34006 RepID=UPI0015F27050|nr:hypothetical protein [Paracoccus thiocyanatus]